MIQYVPETDPFEHQASEFQLHAWDKVHARFWEQGTGKTKQTIDEGAFLFEEQEVGGMFVVAPNGVHRNWTSEELPVHLPKRLRDRLRMHAFRTDRASTKWHQKAVRKVIDGRGFSCLTMSYDGLMTEPGRIAAKEFLLSRPLLYALDESPRIKSHDSERTMRVIASGPYAPYRRILTGTPVTNKPWDVYPQIKFIDAHFWERHDIWDFLQFTTRFGVWEKGYRFDPRRKKKVSYPVLVEYRDLEYLHEILKPIASRITKDVLNLPPKLYSRFLFDLTPEQTRAYEELQEFAFTLLGNEGVVTAPIALTLMLRLQQITCGYLPVDMNDAAKLLKDPDAKVRRFHRFDPNPRIIALNEICEDMAHPALIWGRFRQDIDCICELLDQRGDSYVRYDGAVGEDARARGVKEFQAGDVQYFVSNPSVGGEGLTLTAGRTSIYYSNSFKLSERLQSEDRPHRIGQKNSVTNIDLVADGTIDIGIRENLIAKHDAAAIVTGDRVRSWIRGGADHPAPRSESAAKSLLGMVVGDALGMAGFEVPADPLAAFLGQGFEWDK